MNKVCPNCKNLFNTRGVLCTRCYQKQYYERNKESKSIKKAQYYKDNKEKIDLKSKEYAERNQNKVRKKNKDYYSKNREAVLAYQKKHRVTSQRKFSQGKKSASDRGLTWSIDFESYKTIINMPCDYCGKAVNDCGGVSLDRIDNNVGYEPHNIVPCCGTCNNIRNRFLTREEMKVGMAAIIKFRREQSEKRAT